MQVGVAATAFEYADYYAELPPSTPFDQTPLFAYDILTLLWSLALLPAWIVTSVWLYTVRTNVDQVDRAGQRRGKVWAWIGWIVPIVTLWFPYQVVKDAARTSTTRPLPIGWWWAAWLVATFSLNITAQLTGNGFSAPNPDLVQLLPAFEVLAAIGFVAALALLVPIVLTMSAAQPALAQRLPQPLPPPATPGTPQGPPPPGPIS